jgi:hypothetical protein
LIVAKPLLTFRNFLVPELLIRSDVAILPSSSS